MFGSGFKVTFCYFIKLFLKSYGLFDFYTLQRALGYYEVAELSSSQNAKNLLAREEESRKQNTEAADVTMYKPDFSQMVPFKPKIQWTPGEHIAPGKI